MLMDLNFSNELEAIGFISGVTYCGNPKIKVLNNREPHYNEDLNQYQVILQVPDGWYEFDGSTQTLLAERWL